MSNNVENILVGCSRNILWENSSTDHPYSIGGTCFIVDYHKDLYVVTAKHCFAHRHPNELFVQRYSGSRNSLTFTSLRSQEPTTQTAIDDSDFADVAILTVAKSDLTAEDLAKVKALKILDDSLMTSLSMSKGRLFFRGYPHDLKCANYDTQTISQQGFLSEAIYVRPFISQGCHTLRFAKPEQINTVNQLSGSPLCQEYSDNTGQVHTRLAGMVIRGGVVGDPLIHVVDASFIVFYLEQVRLTPTLPEGEEVFISLSMKRRGLRF